MIEEIRTRSQVLAVVVRGSFRKPGANFVTDNENSMQLGVLVHNAGVQIPPHRHLLTTRVIHETQEVLHIASGSVVAELYDDIGDKVTETRLGTGDTILLRSGGHGIRVLEDCRIVEVKQGPYTGKEADKIHMKDQKG